MCVLIPSLFPFPAQPVLLVSVLGHWNVFVPLAETEEEGRWSHCDLWPAYPPCGNLWDQLCLLWAANRIRRLSVRADVLTLTGHSQTVPTPLTQPDKPLVTHPSSRPRSADLSVGYIPTNWITPWLQGRERRSGHDDGQSVGSSKRRLGPRCLSLAWFSGADGHEDGAADGTNMTWSIAGVDWGDGWFLDILDIYFYSALVLRSRFSQFTTTGWWKQPNLSTGEPRRRKRKSKAKLFIAGRTFVALLMLWWNKV